MRKKLTLLFCLLSVIVFGQIKEDSNRQYKDSLNWLTELGDKGLNMTKDSLMVSEEFQKVLNDPDYRTILYPETYTWEQTIKFIQSKELKKTFWYFINLYPENDTNKELVVKSILAYDKFLKMDEIMVNTFYTYCLMDPKVSVIKDGKPEIFRPDILETKLRNVKEIVGYIYGYREQQKKN